MQPSSVSRPRHLQAAQLILSNSRVIIAAWLVVGVAIPYTRFLAGNHNVYLIFCNSFFHLLNEQNLYIPYPTEYSSTFLYGPLFCLLIAPFAILPQTIGCLLYLLTSAGVLYRAIQSLPLEKRARNGICLLCLLELGNNQQYFQFNAIIAALIILAFTCILRDKSILAAACIALGLFTKIYGLVGLVFLVFCRHKAKLLAALAGWSAVFYFLPVLFSSFQFVNDSYAQWPATLIAHNQESSELGGFQDKSVAGVIRRLTQKPDLSQSPILILGCVLFSLAYLRFPCYLNLRFRFLALASALMFVVLFSSAAENPTYVILQCGVATWFCAGSGLPMRFRVPLLLAVLVFSSITPTDLFPGAIRHAYNQYSLRVLPCVAVWLVVLYEMVTCSTPNKAVQLPRQSMREL